MNDIKEKLQILTQRLSSTATYATAHRFTLLIIIIGVAVSFALFRTQEYLNIPRNEARYTDERAKINYKKIDEQTLDEFQQAAEDQNIEINSQFEPNRDNPFSDSSQ